MVNEYVYFIRGGRLVKIGWAVNPYKRMKELQCGSPVKLEMLGYYPGTQQQEAALHILLGPLRSHGEWFSCGRKTKPIETARLTERLLRARDYMRENPADVRASASSRRLVPGQYLVTTRLQPVPQPPLRLGGNRAI